MKSNHPKGWGKTQGEKTCKELLKERKKMIFAWCGMETCANFGMFSLVEKWRGEERCCQGWHVSVLINIIGSVNHIHFLSL